jgi:hypothetical protein
MAVLAVAAAGAAIGGTIGGTFLGLSAAAWGWTIGSVVGNYLFAPKTNSEGPRLQGIRYSQSSYGASIPIVFGTMRIGSNVIWMGEVQEVVNRQRVGKRAYQTTYTYRQSFAVALCDGPVDGVRRVWFDGQLVFSDEASDVITVVEAAKIADVMSIYTGNETQIPDAAIEAEDGVGNVPGYRGLCYLVFDGLDLTQWGNRIPAITAEVIESGGLGAPNIISLDGLLGDTGGARVDGDEIAVATWVAGVTTTMTIKRYAADGSVNSQEVFSGDLTGYSVVTSQLVVCINDPTIASVPVTITDGILVYYTGFLWLKASYTVDSGGVTRNTISAVAGPDGSGDAVTTGFVRLGDALYAINNDGYDPFVERYQIIDDMPAAAPSNRWRFADHCVVPLTTGGSGFITTDGTHIIARVTIQDGVDFDKYFRLAPDDLAFVDYYSAPTTLMQSFAVYDGMHLGFTTNASGSYTLSQYQIVSGDDAVFIGSEVISPGGDTTLAQIMQVNEGGLVLASDGELSMVPKITPLARTLDDVVEAIVTRAGIGSADIDVTGLASIEVDGYTVDRRTSARSAIEPLMAAYAVDAVESNGKIKFVLRGGSPVQTLYLSALGAESETANSDAVRRTDSRERDAVLPQRIDVSYASLDAAYEIGTQTATRGQVLSEQQVSVELPLALTEESAARIAHRLAYEMWSSRTNCEFATSLQYAALEPTDVIWLERERGGIDRVRITAKTEDEGILRFEAVHDDDGVIVQIASGASLPSPGTIAGGLGSTRAVLFEAPPIDDSHADYPALYVAASPYSGTWPGAELWINTPGETNYSNIGPLSVQTVCGSVTTPPANWSADRGQVDASSVEVSIFVGSLDTVTESSWLNGSNMAVIGGELIGFKTATSLGGGAYRLTGLLRGLHGTDYAGQHGAGEQFALLDPESSAHLFIRPTAQIGVARQFRAVTLGRDVPSTDSLTVSMLARSLMPLPPTYINVVRQANGDRTFRWTRRARAYQAWLEGADIPLVETAESYRVQLIDVDTEAVLRSSTVSTNSYTYAAADIATDYPADPDSIRLKVWQQSAIVGDGEPADVILPWAGDFSGFYEKDWTDSVTSDTTLFGAGTPAMVVEDFGAPFPDDNQLRITTSGGYTQDAKLRFDRVPNFTDGLLKVTVAAQSASVASELGLMARTTYWRNDLNGYGYGVYINHSGNVVLGKGTNSNAGTWTVISSVAHGVTAGSLINLAWRIVGSSHRVFVNGVLKINTTDSTITAAGACGIRLGNPSEGITRPFDDFSVQFNQA